MDDPTKEQTGDEPKNEDSTDNSGDMLEAYKELHKEAEPAPETEPTKATEPEAKEEPTKEEPKLADDDKIDLAKPEGEYNHEEWVAQKEAGIKKVVDRAQERTAEADTKTTEAKKYLDNKEGYDNLLDLYQRLENPETRGETLKEMNEHYTPEYTPELDSDKELASHLGSETDAKIAILEAKLEAATKPILERNEASDAKTALDKRIEDTYAKTELEVRTDSNGYQVDKETYKQAILAHPDLSELDAVWKHCRKEILGHTSELATREAPKKKEIVDSVATKSAVSPETGDMAEVYAHLKSTGQLTS